MLDSPESRTSAAQTGVELWDLSLNEFRARTSGSDPTPGGESVSAVTATLGCSLVQMALAVTTAAGTADVTARADMDAPLAAAKARGEELSERLAAGAGADVIAFENLMSAYRLPRSSEDERHTRRARIAQFSEAAAEAPMCLAETIAETVIFAAGILGQVKPLVASDVLAGADLLMGSYRAALHTVDVNLPAVEPAAAAEIVRRRDGTSARIEGASGQLAAQARQAAQAQKAATAQKTQKSQQTHHAQETR
ncbi:cyclodeaminase/cyclohydrolase family protein [Paenarthrobacter sp. Z7-10]|uniref:cyclodeaminase/cyclohydrolase family protein n=1 Tax=Paenarthrobacter sp. Z7-10 TaxID=2787635 RepID=UPI0022A9C1A4|nr:cyclodeaminase/cyclohydrolase family protein [Paenarthrobacter sp. Z7-10]MCZ2402908.1 cyclodeaminase/cyclohydrolase family protein [Paenarthrobacter sp. Z7-10]